MAHGASGASLRIYQKFLVISDSRPSVVASPLQFGLASMFALVAVSAVLVWLFIYVYPFGPLLAWFGAAILVARVALRTQSRPLGFACAVMFAFGILAVPIFAIEGHCVSPYQLKRIHVGSTAAEVKSVLGKPTAVTANPAGDDWMYSGSTWCQVSISFDSNDVVEFIEHDH